jgi:hypothetical protein
VAQGIHGAQDAVRRKLLLRAQVVVANVANRLKI